MINQSQAKWLSISCFTFVNVKKGTKQDTDPLKRKQRANRGKLRSMHALLAQGRKLALSYPSTVNS
jgi:hypothetical protein